MTTKLNSMRLLERHHIAYTVHEYEYNDAYDAQTIARMIGVPASQVFKTLVVGGAGVRPILAMVPADAQLSLKRLAALIGVKSLDLLPRADVERLTGLQIGGIGALALTAKGWTSYLDESALQYPIVYVNAGKRGILLGLAPTELVRVVGAKVGAIAERG